MRRSWGLFVSQLHHASRRTWLKYYKAVPMPPIGGKRPDPFTCLRRLEVFSLFALGLLATTNPTGLAQDKAVQISCEVEF
jgi:hypothetical protein